MGKIAISGWCHACGLKKGFSHLGPIFWGEDGGYKMVRGGKKNKECLSKTRRHRVRGQTDKC